MDAMLTPAATWLALGFLLVALELASGAAVLIFCGLGALAVGVLLLTGIELSPSWQIVLAASISVAATMLCRPVLRRFLRPRGGGFIDHVGGTVVAETAVDHTTPGVVRHRGTVWQARTIRGQSLAAGESGVVTGVEGIELRVRRV